MKQFFKNLLMFCVGFTGYMIIEGVWKTFISGGQQSFLMGLIGGIMFLCIGQLNKWFTWEMPIILQITISAIVITAIEFIVGLILNVWLKLNIWDYSMVPLNIMGQICVPFFFAWVLIALISVLVDDFLRWKVYDEEKPHYHILKWGKDK